MARPSPQEPPQDLHERPLPLLTRFNQTWVRISLKIYPNPIYWSKQGQYRFDSPDAKFGVLYSGESLECSLLEIFGDRWIGAELADRRIARSTLQANEVISFKISDGHRFVDLSGSNLNLLGADAGVFSGPYEATRKWGQMLMEHPEEPDGILFPSRKNERLRNLALFNKPHIVESLNTIKIVSLEKAEGLSKILSKYKVVMYEL